MITSNVIEHIHFKNEFLKNDADILQKFLEAERKPELHRVLCDTCQRYSKSCDNCCTLNRQLSLEDKAWLAKFWENTKLIDINGKKKIMVTVPYKNPVEKTFPASENNYSQAVGTARGIVRKLHNKISNLAILIYNCRFHANGDSQEFKIEEMLQGQL